MEHEYYIESEPPSRRQIPSRGQQQQQGIYPSRFHPAFALFVGLPVLFFWLLLEHVSDALSRSFAGSFWDTIHPWLAWSCGIIVFVCGVIIAWQLYLWWDHAWSLHTTRQARKQHFVQKQEAHEQSLVREQERLEIERQRNADLAEIEIQKIQLQQMLATLEHERLVAERKRLILNAGQTAIFPEENYYRVDAQPALPSGKQQRELPQHAESKQEDVPEREILLPDTPQFWDIVDLITPERMPLCFVADNDPESPSYGQTVPMFGTIDDLLSLCVIGKPGRGKTVLLMYYTMILSVYGAETHIFDPHGVMAELALLHGRRLPGMPETARIFYYDRKDQMEKAVKRLNREMDDRDQLYRPHIENGELVRHQVKHPLLILADELPILADFDEQVRAEYKERNKDKPVDKREEVPSLMYLIRRTVLEARKWRMFFIGSSQSIDAGILPTRVTDALNSRIVFFNSDRKARMVGLEADVIKKMLPLIRRAGPGMTIYDCARWDGPKIGGIPNVTVEDMLEFFGVNLQDLAERWVVESGQEDEMPPLSAFGTGGNQRPQLRVVSSSDGYRTGFEAKNLDFQENESGVQSVLEGGQNGLVERSERGSEQAQNEFIPAHGEKVLSDLQKQLLITYYKDCRDVKLALRRIKSDRGEGLGVGTYYRHACFVLDGLKLRKKQA